MEFFEYITEVFKILYFAFRWLVITSFTLIIFGFVVYYIGRLLGLGLAKSFEEHNNKNNGGSNENKK